MSARWLEGAWRPLLLSLLSVGALPAQASVRITMGNFLAPSLP